MVNDDDIVELVVDTLKKDRWKDFACPPPLAEDTLPHSGHKVGFFVKEKFIKSSTTLPMGRRFITEYEIKNMIKGGVKEISVPEKAIISPLAQEILSEKGVRVVRTK